MVLTTDYRTIDVQNLNNVHELNMLISVGFHWTKFFVNGTCLLLSKYKKVFIYLFIVYKVEIVLCSLMYMSFNRIVQDWVGNWYEWHNRDVRHFSEVNGVTFRKVNGLCVKGLFNLC